MFKLTGLPNGNPLATPHKSPATTREGAHAWPGSTCLQQHGRDRCGIETHGPYLHGSGFLAANGAPSLQLFPANLPAVRIGPVLRGPGQHNTFASEFGCIPASSP